MEQDCSKCDLCDRPLPPEDVQRGGCVCEACYAELLTAYEKVAE